ncbi:hypothetical protein E5672_03780 [Alteromonas portus]|uniref:Right-handed parallel beta-helix repeat-containing protein n=1 Tax=Alteromonas portus TaxID=2565549 RepID=A0A4U0ZMU6_9ALTE|nr:hypothetical protein [Alteromonas portus]TKB05212.1 hypothetical protein E5672_03780 [Alteromonas portus]
MRNTNNLDETVSSIGLLVKNDVLSAPLFKENIFETARILYEAKKSTVVEAVSSLSAEQPQKAADFIELALRLFPKKRMQIVENLKLDDSIDEDAVTLAAIRSGISPSDIVPPTASGETHRIVPLIHSASITLFDQDKENTTKVRFKKVEDNQWKEGLHLYWEPVRQALSGSLVHLEANTQYDVEITVTSSGLPSKILTFEFATRAETPPVDPNLVYRLSDIYNGGMLDITSLDIQGKEGGWAKIIGDENTPIVAGEYDDYAINIGNNSYIMFENIVVKGGRRHGIFSRDASHLWFKGCNVSQWGRGESYYKNGIAYEVGTNTPINYDGGMTLVRTGIVVVEECTIHSPAPKANHWGFGHPKGPAAMLILANSYDESLQGQYIIRNNRFYGTDEHRFNDVIESRLNGRSWGGFIRDSAIYNNYLAYANDDIIELDGGQSNVLFYNNEIEQAYCGVSATPNMLGPSYIFNNYIHNLGDQRQKSWAAFKLGGLFSRPAGIVNIFNNFVLTNSNGIAHASFAGDSSFWVHAQNNVLIHNKHWHNMGFSINDPGKYGESVYLYNLMYNTIVEDSVYNANITDFFAPQEESKMLEEITSSVTTEPFISIAVPYNYHVLNFSEFDNDGNLIIGKSQD